MNPIGNAIGPLTLWTFDGKSFDMSNYAARRGTLLVILSSRSPATVEVVDTIARIAEKYRRKEILFVGLIPNDAEATDEWRAFYQRHDLRFPSYRDPGGKIAKRLHARVTPEAFLLDAQGVLVYRGGFHGDGAAEDLDATLAAFLRGEPIPKKTSRATGTPIQAEGTPADATDPTVPIAFSSEVIFEKIAWAPDHHCATLAEAPNGDLLCVWYGGPFECHDDEALYIARRKQGECAWSVPEKLVTGTFLHPPGNAVVFRLSPTRVAVAWDRMDEPRPIRSGRWGAGQLMIRYSDDSGVTWSEDTELRGLGGGLRNVPITLTTGELMLPVSGGKPAFLMTSNAGATWSRSGEIDKGGQPTVIERNDGSLLALLRNQPCILQSESRDRGRTWSPATPSALRCPGAGVAMYRLRNGHLVVVFNDSATERTPLSIALSVDEGATWKTPLELEPNPGEYSYPCVIKTSDDRIHVCYSFLRRTIKHVAMTEEWMHALASPEDRLG